MKQCLQFLASFLVLLILSHATLFFGGGEFFKLLPPIAYLVLFAGGLLRVLAGVLLLCLETALHYVDEAQYLEAKGDYAPRCITILEATLASACVAAASVLVSTQTRPWVFCAYLAVTYILLGISADEIQKIRVSKSESS